MRVGITLLVALLFGFMGVAAFAQDKKEDEKVNCLDVASKHLRALTDATVREQKPRGACALARWGVQRHEELLRAFSIEPEECRKDELGKKAEDTLKSRIRDETRMRKRHCKRS